MSTYFNDLDPFCTAWLERLFPDSTVHRGSIRAVTPEQVKGHRRVHLFAGVGGWELALRYAGWPDDRPVWTGSCPCQPFSQAGRRRGEADRRHLWPDMLRLVTECRPATVFGEQVSGPAGHRWLARVRLDLEGIGYRVGAADLPAACVGAPFIGQRIYWVATPARPRRPQRVGHASVPRPPQDPHPWAQSGGGNHYGVRGRDGRLRRTEPGVRPLAHGVPGRVGQIRAYGNAIVPQVAAAFVRAFLGAEVDLADG